MKPATAAAKMGIYLPATPPEFQRGSFTRADLEALREDPPAWLVALRRNGPFPRDVVAQKLGISRSAVTRGGLVEAPTAEQIGELLAKPPRWLIRERELHRDHLAELARLKAANKDS